MSAIAKLGCCVFVSLTCCAGASGEGLHHYVFFNGMKRNATMAPNDNTTAMT
jgi:hypothetical protein